MKRTALLLLLPFAGLLAQDVFTTDLSHGDVGLKLTMEPAVVDPVQDTVVTLTLLTPDGTEAVLPDLRERFLGFSRAEDFAREPVSVGSMTRSETVWRLTPAVAEKYVLRPFAVDVRRGGTATSFATRPVTLPAAPLPEFVEGPLEVDTRPVYVAPGLRTIARWAAFAVAGLILLALIIWALMHIRRVVREHRMTPGERAFAELERLLTRGYLEKGLYKEFYIELTHVVRRYIERAHGIHAPQQTTEEFLQEASRHPSFKGEVLTRLKEFLESADLIKFAGVQATPTLAENSTTAARRYIESDTAGNPQ